MFRTRMTEAWGAPTGVGGSYLLEQLVEHQSGRRLARARERASGIRRWLIFAKDSSHEAALRDELAVLRHTGHQVIAKLAAEGEPGVPVWFALEWQGEALLDAEMLPRVSAIDRLRFIPGLVDAVEHLAGLGAAIEDFKQCQLWVTPALHAVRLVGLPGARSQAGEEAIARMRGAAADMLTGLTQAGADGEAETQLARLLSNWGRGDASLVEVHTQLKQVLMEAVTADL